MNNQKQKDILEKYAELLEDLQKALFAPETTEAIRAAGKKYELTLDKVGELGDETGLVMMGITPPSDYVKNLIQRLGVAPEKAKAIAEEINQKIFQPVRESLKKVHGLAKAEPKPLPPPPTPSFVRRGEEIKTSPPLQGGTAPRGEVKPLPQKPLPIPQPATKPLPPLNVIPPIFVKKMPEPAVPTKPDIIPQKPIAPIIAPQKPTYQDKDPYHEPIE